MNIEAASNTSVPSQIEYEAKYLYRCLFSREAPNAIVDMYVDAHSQLPELRFESINKSHQLRTLEIILSRQLNAVAIEPWLRKGSSRHPVSSKLLLLSYIAESCGEHLEFSRDSDGGWLDLAIAGSSGAFQLLYGFYLKLRYGLV